MEYSLCKVIDCENDIEFIDIMDSFDCICSLMTKVNMIGRNFSVGDYVVLSHDYELGDENVELRFSIDDFGEINIHER